MGFTIRESMTGTHTFVDGRDDPGPHPFEFRLRWGPERLRDWLSPLSDRFLWQEAKGEVRAGGLCDWTACAGTLSLEYGRARIRYAFDFEVDGVAYRYTGEKRDLRPWNLHRTHTTCYGELRELETDRLISTSTVRFRLRTTPRFLGSLRWA